MKKSEKRFSGKETYCELHNTKTIALVSTLILLVILASFGIIQAIQKHSQELNYNAEKLRTLDYTMLTKEAQKIENTRSRI